MSKVTAFTLSTLRNEEILGMSLEIAEKLKTVKSVADSTQGKAFLDAIPAYASALDLEKTLTYKDLVQADAAVDQAITGLRMHLQALLGYPDDDTQRSCSPDLERDRSVRFPDTAKLSGRIRHRCSYARNA